LTHVLQDAPSRLFYYGATWHRGIRYLRSAWDRSHGGLINKRSLRNHAWARLLRRILLQSPFALNRIELFRKAPPGTRFAPARNMSDHVPAEAPVRHAR
jgi:hypothetical protein